jgi:hypothetical protein
VTTSTLQILIGNALTDRTFRAGLLNGSRRRILSSFALTTEEIETIMGIQADSLEQFAGQLHERFLAKEEEPEMPPTCIKYRHRTYPLERGVLE